MKVKQTDVIYPRFMRRAETIPSQSGSYIIEWDYLKDGAIHHDEMNFDEKIQSYARQTDYKTKIEKGEVFENESGLYMDVSKLGNDPNSINEYLTNLVNSLQQDIQKAQVCQGNTTANQEDTTDTKEVVENPSQENTITGGDK